MAITNAIDAHVDAERAECPLPSVTCLWVPKTYATCGVPELVQSI